jgi:hypothetical protein
MTTLDFSYRDATAGSHVSHSEAHLPTAIVRVLGPQKKLDIQSLDLPISP